MLFFRKLGQSRERQDGRSCSQLRFRAATDYKNGLALRNLRKSSVERVKTDNSDAGFCEALIDSLCEGSFATGRTSSYPDKESSLLCLFFH